MLNEREFVAILLQGIYYFSAICAELLLFRQSVGRNYIFLFKVTKSDVPKIKWYTLTVKVNSFIFLSFYDILDAKETYFIRFTIENRALENLRKYFSNEIMSPNTRSSKINQVYSKFL